ncbi:MAG: NAD(P)/FAD-dependent oxidoreductase [Lachnospiraceae bacterium]|nr:NAD(P)/FAD-dependent oxidoreductase [Lachnospiraceae bacterium]
MTSAESGTDVLVIGCGAAGMFAAIHAAAAGARVTVLEQNDKAGKKIYITGKGRCNLTNDCGAEEILEHTIRGKKFLYSAVYGCDSGSVQRFFSERGCPLKTERGGRVFPVSDKSSDIIRVLTKEMERLGVCVRYGTRVRELLTEDGRVRGVLLADGTSLTAEAVIIATGGLSYPATGATGDGYRFAKSAGHQVTECRPSLVPFETAEAWHKELQGLTLKNVRLYMLPAPAETKAGGGSGKARKKMRFDEQGELLFTHFGVSGPLVLTACALLNDALHDGAGAGEEGHGALPLRLAIDCKPALGAEELDRRLLRDFSAQPRRQFKNSLGGLFPASLIPVMCALAEECAGIAPDTPAGELTRAQRLAFGALMKALPVTVTGTRGFSEAVITRGGVELKEIRPSTMASKLCDGLFFAGEGLDCDALTGGFNLQIAWSTGALAGRSAAESAKV